MATPSPRILIADDEPLFLKTTGELLTKAGYECVCVADAQAALDALARERFDLVLSDLNMPGNLQLELLREGRTQWPEVPLIVITGVPSLPTAIESLRLGIADYLLKPVELPRLAVQHPPDAGRPTPRGLPASRAATTSGGNWRGDFPEIVGDSPRMLELFDIIDRIARTDTNILITGESGTGKEIVARTIHRDSRRAAQPFLVVDCTTIPENLFESVLFGHAQGAFTGAVRDEPGLLRQVQGGTAFFDEIGELPALAAGEIAAGRAGSDVHAGRQTSRRCGWTRGLSAPPIATWRWKSTPGGFAATCSTAWPCCTSNFHRSAIGAMTSCGLPSTSWPNCAARIPGSRRSPRMS